MMARTSRMDQLEALLKDDPEDAFLRYGLAMEYASQGDDASAAKQLEELIVMKRSSTPYVPAYLQCGQAYQRLGRDADAIRVLQEGIEIAGRVGDFHARGEMEGLLSTLS